MSLETRGLIAWIVGGVLALTFALFPDWWTIDRFIAAFSAFGTVAAVVVALAMPLKQLREAQLRESKRATLTAIRLVGALNAASASIEVLSMHMSVSIPPPTSERDEVRIRYNNAILDLVISCVQNPVWDIAPDDIEALASLPNAAAHRLQYACSAISRLAPFVKSAQLKWEGMSATVQRSYLVQWYAKVDEANAYLKPALAECASAAATGALEPTPEERAIRLFH